MITNLKKKMEFTELDSIRSRRALVKLTASGRITYAGGGRTPNFALVNQAKTENRNVRKLGIQPNTTRCIRRNTKMEGTLYQAVVKKAWFPEYRSAWYDTLEGAVADRDAKEAEMNEARKEMVS